MSQLLTVLASPPRRRVAAVVGPLLQDTFTDPNGTYLANHTPETGGPWVTPSGLFPQWYTIENNKVTSVNIASGGMEANVGAANVSLTGKLSVVNANFMNVRLAVAAVDFSGGVRCRLNYLDQKLDVLDGGNSVYATTPFTVAQNTEYAVTIKHYRGHTLFTAGATTLHAWTYDYILGGPDSGYAALVPTGTKLGPDWTATNNGSLDDLVVSALVRADAKHFVCIGDSITPFDRTSPATSWPMLVAQSHNGGVTQLRTYCGGGEGLSKGGSSLNTALNQAQNLVANADDPDYVIVHIGTNDAPADVAATGSTVQALMEQLLDYLTTNGVAASKIRVMQILPNTTETYHPANRTAIAAACTSRGVTLWDTSAWINPTSGVDTTDGLHPNATGHQKIATEVLARL